MLDAYLLKDKFSIDYKNAVFFDAHIQYCNVMNVLEELVYCLRRKKKCMRGIPSSLDVKIALKIRESLFTF